MSHWGTRGRRESQTNRGGADDAVEAGRIATARWHPKNLQFIDEIKGTYHFKLVIFF
jgi:hypothetical protein